MDDVRSATVYHHIMRNFSQTQPTTTTALAFAARSYEQALVAGRTTPCDGHALAGRRMR